MGLLETFTAETFRPLLHERFALAGGDRQVDLELVDVTESAAPGANRSAQFWIVFSGPPDPILPQATYELEHPELGAFELFLVPIAAGRYEAVFT